jgi:Protein of unknown function (DUF3515)
MSGSVRSKGGAFDFPRNCGKPGLATGVSSPAFPQFAGKCGGYGAGARRVAGLVTVVAVVMPVVTACGGDGDAGPVEVDPPQLTSASAEQCEDLVKALPDAVAEQDGREVSPIDAAAAAWGDDPPIVLRCGVPKPEALQPDSPCFVVNDVGWFAEEQPDGVTFTTIGRSTYVEVNVPDDYGPEADALPAVAKAVRSATRELSRCV